MKLKKYITELAMKSDRTKIDVKKKRGFHYNAKIQLEDGTQWFFNAVNNMGEGDWDISFWASELADTEVEDKHKAGIQLFAAVENLTKEFLKYEKPEQFRFSATGVSRIKLYNTLAKKIIKGGEYKKGQYQRMLQGNNWSFIRK